MKKIYIGAVTRGIVTGIEKYGIFLKFENDYVGMIHISEVSFDFVSDLTKIASIGDDIKVKIIGVDDKCKRVNCSIKGISYRNNYASKKIIKETKHGFNSLKNKLSFWINDELHR